MLGKDFYELYEKNKGGCDHKCKSCGLFLENKNRCTYEEEKLWKEWNKKVHDEMDRYLHEIK